MTNVVDLREGTAPSAVGESARWHLSSLEQVDRALRGGPPVAVLLWPAEADAAHRLAELDLPRLLLLGPEGDPVCPTSPLEDWVRLPVRDADVLARVQRLRHAAERQPPRPLVADDGRLVFQGAWVSLPEVDERIARALVRTYRVPVTEEDLLAAGWPGLDVPHATLRPRISRLRRRIASLGLSVVALRGLGYALQPSHVDAALE